jgi:predicted dithiol-disulfide oxidoreductase (DUF899 family)
MSTAITPPAPPASLPKVVSRSEWLASRKKLLAREKELTHAHDALNAERRRLPMVKLDKNYTFESADGKRVKLLDLFGGRRQLIVYHFMFDPNDPPAGKSGHPWEEGCNGCSFVADNFPDGDRLAHLHSRDTNLVLVSRAPQAKIKPFKDRMGWDIPWFSSFGTDFNYDFNATTDEAVRPIEYNYMDKAALEKTGETYHLSGEQPALSVFLRDDAGSVYHTYSTYGRGLEAALGTYHLLDLTPYGRLEQWEDSPAGWPKPVDSVGAFKHHDKYECAAGPNCCCAERKKP